ncbi:MAG TPA: hypothetical protein VGA42_05980 [Gemmatimonadales bacterium]
MKRPAIAFPLIGLLLIACEGPGPADSLSGLPAFTTGPGLVVASASGAAHRIRADELWVLSFTAVRHEDGSASGRAHVDRKDLGIAWDVNVTCMSVVGNTAWIAGIIENGRGPIVRDGTVSYFYVIDNGENAEAPVDIASAVRLNDLAGQDQVFCTDRPLLLTPSPIAHGDIQVRGQ